MSEPAPAVESPEESTARKGAKGPSVVASYAPEWVKWVQRNTHYLLEVARAGQTVADIVAILGEAIASGLGKAADRIEARRKAA